ncbi:MAG: FHA domain-containing protein [Pseudomonadota bacterium]|nr:FHA domain-containing protein [Pseudomonadota bacterium]
MATESGQPQEVDLDSTDRLPILEGVLFDPDVADDAVRLDRAPPAPDMSLAAAGAPSEFTRPPSIDLPSLAESMRSVEERIARQSAENGALTRAHERSLEAAAASAARAKAMERDLAAARNALQSEQARARELERNQAENSGFIESALARAEGASREAERQQAETRTLRDSLAARDATIVQVLHSLSERDAQLSALQAEHARALPALEARAKNGTQLAEELLSVRGQLNTALAELKLSHDQARVALAQLKRGESELNSARAELATSKTQAISYLELLRTRDWRSGFEQNLFRDMDARVSADRADARALTAERDRMQGQVTALEASVAAQKATIDKLQSAADQALAVAQAAGTEGTQLIAQLQSEHAAKIAELEADARTRDEEMTVLMAHLQEARRPIESIEGDARRSREELALKTAALVELTGEAEKLRTALERTRGALEEREFLIRRLERSESNNANVLGRIQTSMERLGSVATPGTGVVPVSEWAPELIRIDGDRSISHTLGRRTRIGRASGCELHIDSSSVSRHHALILAGTREAIIEDLNSTNGVILNGRKVTRQVLNDGDIVTIGEIQFRYVAKPLSMPSRGDF